MKLIHGSASYAAIAVLIVLAGGTWQRQEAGQSVAAASAAAFVKATSANVTAFEPNWGQTDPEVKFLSRGRGYTLFLANVEATLVVHRARPSWPGADALADIRSSGQAVRQTSGGFSLSSPYFPRVRESSRAGIPPSARNARKDLQATDSVVRMKLLGANPSAEMTGVGMLQGRTNYFTGNDPKNWRTNVPRYGSVKYQGVYPGVDLVYYGSQGQMEYDFVVAPGADPAAIRLTLDARRRDHRDGDRRDRVVAAFDSLRITPDGDLLVRIDSGEVRFHKPVIYQPEAPLRSGAGPSSAKSHTTLVDGHYKLSGRNQVSFDIAEYDHRRPLVIDPVLSYSTYLGGTDDEGIFGIKFDSHGNIYVAGETSSVDFPIAGGVQSTLGGDYDGFITEFDPTGTSLIYSTYLGGSGYDHCVGLAVDSRGGAYVAGYTESADFPTVHALQSALKGPQNAFVARLAPGGSSLIYSTYLGGSGSDGAGDIVIDPHGNAYVAGFTFSADFPVTQGAFQTVCDAGTSGGACLGDAFVAKFNPSGSRLFYSTYLGGNATDGATDIAVDNGGAAYVTGYTWSNNFPTKDPYQVKFGGTSDAFVTRLDPTGASLLYSTYLGGSGQDQGNGLAIDSSGNIYVAGLTTSTDFPLANPYQSENMANGFDGFVTKFEDSGRRLAYSTYLGGSGTNLPWRIGVDALGHAAVAGFTGSTDFPQVHSLQAFGGGSYDAFVTLFDSPGSQPLYSTYLGGSGDEYGYALNAEHTGSVWVGGSTSSLDFPVVKPFQASYAGGPYDAFLSKITARQPH
jgi:hypothetical protein